MKTVMIYGATGYTGRMVAEHAIAAGVPVVLAGRDMQALQNLSLELGVPHTVVTVDDARGLEEALSHTDVLINCAGPFFRTAVALMEAAIRAGVHYIDTSAELISYELAEAFAARAEAAGVMLMPGGGGSVAMLGSLASVAAGDTAEPDRIRIALQVAGPMSRGSAISAMEGIGQATLKREGGVLVANDAGNMEAFDFGHGPVDCFAVTLPDLITVWHATGAPNIETYVHVSGGGFPSGDLSELPAGPTRQERDANRYRAVVEVFAADGSRTMALLDTVNGYTFTAMAAAEAGRRAWLGEHRAGFQTPVGVFGSGFAETIADTTIRVAAV